MVSHRADMGEAQDASYDKTKTLRPKRKKDFQYRIRRRSREDLVNSWCSINICRKSKSVNVMCRRYHNDEGKAPISTWVN